MYLVAAVSTAFTAALALGFQASGARDSANVIRGALGAALADLYYDVAVGVVVVAFGAVGGVIVGTCPATATATTASHSVSDDGLGVRDVVIIGAVLVIPPVGGVSATDAFTASTTAASPTAPATFPLFGVLVEVEVIVIIVFGSPVFGLLISGVFVFAAAVFSVFAGAVRFGTLTCLFSRFGFNFWRGRK